MRKPLSVVCGDALSPEILLSANALCLPSSTYCSKYVRLPFPSGVTRRWKKLSKNVKIAYSCGKRVSVCSTPEKVYLVTFPVQPAFAYCNRDRSNVLAAFRHNYNPGDRIPGCDCTPLSALVEESAKSLVVVTDDHGWEKVLIPQFSFEFSVWQDMVAALNVVLDSRFIIVSPSWARKTQ